PGIERGSGKRCQNGGLMRDQHPPHGGPNSEKSRPEQVQVYELRRRIREYKSRALDETKLAGLSALLFDKQEEPLPLVCDGSQADTLQGLGATRQAPAGYNPGWFVEDTTFILGTGAKDTHELKEPSSAAWHF